MSLNHTLGISWSKSHLPWSQFLLFTSLGENSPPLRTPPRRQFLSYDSRSFVITEDTRNPISTCKFSVAMKKLGKTSNRAGAWSSHWWSSSRLHKWRTRWYQQPFGTENTALFLKHVKECGRHSLGPHSTHRLPADQLTRRQPVHRASTVDEVNTLPPRSCLIRIEPVGDHPCPMR